MLRNIFLVFYQIDKYLTGYIAKLSPLNVTKKLSFFELTENNITVLQYEHDYQLTIKVGIMVRSFVIKFEKITLITISH